MDIYKECFEDLSSEEKSCASMCESMIAYKSPLHGYSDKEYLTKYRVSLGNKRVEEIYNTLKEYIQKNYILKENVFTDSDGQTYNSLIRKEGV